MRDHREDNYGEKQGAAIENTRKAASQEPPTLMSQEDYRRGLRLMTSIGRRSPPTSAPRRTFRETLAERDRVRCREQAAALRAMRSSSFGEATAAAGTLS